jgi:hypothetical protein
LLIIFWLITLREYNIFVGVGIHSDHLDTFTLKCRIAPDVCVHLTTVVRTSAVTNAVINTTLTIFEIARQPLRSR